jgi:hypothetical protein
LRKICISSLQNITEERDRHGGKSGMEV